MLVTQGDGPGALGSYRKGLEIREALVARDPANTGWQTDLAVSCANLGTLENTLTPETRRDNLLRGRQILIALESEGRLLPSQNWIGWFDAQLSKLPADDS